MTISISEVPIWVSILFVLIFSTIPVFLISNTVKKVLSVDYKSVSIKISKNIIIFYWSYFLVIASVSLTGFFKENALPPRIILLAVIPLLLFYLFYVQNRYWFQQVFKNISLAQLIFIHVFRFVGVFFFLNYAYEALPKTFAYIGGTGDILTAILVFPVIWSLKNQKKHYQHQAHNNKYFLLLLIQH